MTLVEVSHLTKSYGAVKAVDDISFAIERGRCTALLGPNGAGKTTTLNMLAGLLRPTSGAIAFEGLGADGDRRAMLGYLPQQVALLGWMTGREYLRMVGELFGLRRAEADKRAGELLEALGLAEAASRRIGGYSGGMKQRLGLAQAMVLSPPLLILDEPVTGLDPVGRRDVLELLKRLKTESTILFSTHVLPDAEEISDDVLIIRRGEIVVDDSLGALRERYEQPTIEIEFETETLARQWAAELGRGAGREPELRQAIVRFRYDDARQARDSVTAIYRQVGEGGVPARRVELGQTTLEDLFLRAIAA